MNETKNTLESQTGFKIECDEWFYSLQHADLVSSLAYHVPKIILTKTFSNNFAQNNFVQFSVNNWHDVSFNIYNQHGLLVSKSKKLMSFSEFRTTMKTTYGINPDLLRNIRPADLDYNQHPCPGTKLGALDGADFPAVSPDAIARYLKQQKEKR
jgi:hypothetical protein